MSTIMVLRKGVIIMSIYDFEVAKTNGEKYSLSEYKNSVVLIVNTASECGFTPQFEGLEELYQSYKDQGFVVLGFPCNQFGNQEPGDAYEAYQNCKLNYGVTFPMHEKINVKGANKHPLYEYLTNAKKGILNGAVKWNFTKFLVNKEGEVVQRFAPQKNPNQLNKEIEALL